MRGLFRCSQKHLRKKGRRGGEGVSALISPIFSIFLSCGTESGVREVKSISFGYSRGVGMARYQTLVGSEPTKGVRLLK